MSEIKTTDEYSWSAMMNLPADRFEVTSGNRLWSDMVDEEFGVPDGIIIYPFVDEYGQTYEDSDDDTQASGDESSGCEERDEEPSTNVQAPETEKTNSTVAEIETSSDQLLQSGVVKKDLEKESEEIIIHPKGGNKEVDEEPSADVQEPEKDGSTGPTPLTVAEIKTSPPKPLWSEVVKKNLKTVPTPILKNVQTEKDKPQGSPSSVTPKLEDIQVTRSQAFVPNYGPNSGYVRRQRTPTMDTGDQNSRRNQVDFKMQHSAIGQRKASEYHHKQMNHRNQPLDIGKSELLKKNLLLTEEKEKRIAAEEDCEWSWKKLTALELRLEEEQQLRLAHENELSRCKDMIQNLSQASKDAAAKREAQSKLEEAQMLRLENEREKLKKQIQEKISSTRELESKIRTQEDMTESLEWKVAEIRVQLKSTLVTAEVNPDAPESSGSETDVSELTVCTQTEDCGSENISEPKEDSKPDLLDAVGGFPETTDCVQNRNLENLAPKLEASAPEQVSEAEEIIVAPENLAPKIKASTPEMTETQFAHKPKELSQVFWFGNQTKPKELPQVEIKEVSQPPVVSPKHDISGRIIKKATRGKKSMQLTDNTKECEIVKEKIQVPEVVSREDPVFPTEPLVETLITEKEYKPSFLRRLKKAFTPWFLRQYKHKRGNQD